MDNTEEVTGKITIEDIEKHKELSALISSFRKTLGPKKEEITVALKKNCPMKDIFEIMEFEGKTSGTYQFEYDGKPIEVRIKIRKTSA